MSAPLTRTAGLLREAIAAATAALEAAEDGSDDEARCNEILDDLENALSAAEWKPPVDSLGDGSTGRVQ